MSNITLKKTALTAAIALGAVLLAATLSPKFRSWVVFGPSGAPAVPPTP